MSDPVPAATQLADRFWEELLAISPLFATEIGDERFDHLLPDPSEAGRARQEAVSREALRDLAAIDRPSLPEVLRGTMDILEAVARRMLDDVRHRLDFFQAFTHFSGPAGILGEIASVQRADSPERVARYLERLRRIPAYLAAYEPVMREAVDAGLAPPAVVVDRTIGQAERLVATGPERSPALGPVPPGDADTRERIVGLTRDELWPAFARFLEALRRHRPAATETIGLCALPSGDEIYATQVRGFTTLPLDPREVHATGLERLAAIQDERREAAARLGFADPRSAIRAHTESGQNVAGSREELLERARRQVEAGWQAARGFFGRMPLANCEVRPVEEFREADMPFAYYHGPTGDNSRPGAYYVNTSDLPERPLHQLATTTYHEANPGHHFQISIEQELTGRPALRRFGGILAGSAFIEGWGLYGERLADEMGLYEDEHERLGMLDMQAFRACRLVADTGIHALGWDRDRAVAQMMEAGATRLESEIEVDRYITLPGQALSYMIGQIEIQAWRDAERVRRGPGFDVRDFHDRLLALGSLPLPALRREMAPEDAAS